MANKKVSLVDYLSDYMISVSTVGWNAEELNDLVCVSISEKLSEEGVIISDAEYAILYKHTKEYVEDMWDEISASFNNKVKEMADRGYEEYLEYNRETLGNL